MEIVCLGLSHHTAPVEVRERFAVPDHAVATSAVELTRQPGVVEALIVSTCNRVEYYAAAEKSDDAYDALSRFIAARAGDPTADAFFFHASPRSVQHLFRVVSGLDSMVLGETEILGQMKKAYQAAHAAGATGRHLNKLFQRAFNVAKEVRTNTNITRGSVSVGSVAVELAERIFGRLAECHVMILGAGETSELTAGALQARGVKAIFVANRTYDRAAELAAKMGGRAIHFDEWAADFHEVDILIGSTASPHPVVTVEKLAPLMRSRQDRPLFCIDLAVPRDFEAAVNDLEGVYLYDIDSLQQIADRSMAVRQQEVIVCEQLIERHVVEFGQWLAAGPRPPGTFRPQTEGAK
ncbi:MAG: glutamyl-tRNA reductase [Chthoniobacteraceae bacterium]